MADAQPMISIVDDDLSVRRALSRLVRLAGFAVESFASAREFLESAPRGRTACLVLDIRSEGPHPSRRSVATKRCILLGCLCVGSLAGFETAEHD